MEIDFSSEFTAAKGWLNAQKLGPSSLLHVNGGFKAWFPAARYDDLRRLSERLKGKPGEWQIERYGLDNQTSRAVLFFRRGK